MSKTVLFSSWGPPHSVPLEGPLVPGPGLRPSVGTEFLVKVCWNTSDPCLDLEPGSQSYKFLAACHDLGLDQLLLEQVPLLWSKTSAMEGPQSRPFPAYESSCYWMLNSHSHYRPCARSYCSWGWSGWWGVHVWVMIFSPCLKWDVLPCPIRYWVLVSRTF